MPAPPAIGGSGGRAVVPKHIWWRSLLRTCRHDTSVDGGPQKGLVTMSTTIAAIVTIS